MSLPLLLLTLVYIKKCPECSLKRNKTVSLVQDRIFKHLILTARDKLLSEYSQQVSTVQHVQMTGQKVMET